MRAAVAAALVASSALGAPAAAQEWPTRPITMVVPYAAGGPVDTVGRVLAAGLGEILGQQVVVENIGGAGGMTGSARVARASPDGYTFLLGGSAVLAQIPSFYRKPLYDAIADFAPVALVTDSARVLVTRKDLPPNTFAEFVAYAKANQDKLQYGSAGAGSGSHVCPLLLDAVMGTRITHVPYRGAGPAMQDLIAGRIDFITEQISTAVSQIRAGTVKGIVTLGLDRAAVLPDLPTAKELGYGDLDCSAWAAFVFPKGVPEAIVRKLERAANETVETPSVRDRLAQLGVTIPAPARRTTEYLARFIPAEIAKWEPLIKASGISAD